MTAPSSHRSRRPGRGHGLGLGEAALHLCQVRRLWLRDGGCTYPGCDAPPQWTDVITSSTGQTPDPQTTRTLPSSASGTTRSCTPAVSPAASCAVRSGNTWSGTSPRQLRRAAGPSGRLRHRERTSVTPPHTPPTPAGPQACPRPAVRRRSVRQWWYVSFHAPRTVRLGRARRVREPVVALRVSGSPATPVDDDRQHRHHRDTDQDRQDHLENPHHAPSRNGPRALAPDPSVCRRVTSRGRCAERPLRRRAGRG